MFHYKSHIVWICFMVFFVTVILNKSYKLKESWQLTCIFLERFLNFTDIEDKHKAYNLQL